MKLHLPSSLYRAVMALFAAVTMTLSAEGSIINASASQTTYSDFGQNMGRYVVGGNVNALLQSIRDTKGVQIEYVDGHDPITLVSGSIMPDFSAAGSPGNPSQFMGYNLLATVNHNGVISPRFNNSASNLYYVGIEYRSSSVFKEKYPILDYKVTRLSKLVTDVTATPCYTGTWSGLQGLSYVHCGAGTQQVYDYSTGVLAGNGGAYTYNNGGASTIMVTRNIYKGETSNIVTNHMTTVSETTPLPWVGLGGDSGSSCFVWNPNTKQYEYVGTFEAYSASNTIDVWSSSNGDYKWHETVNDKFTEDITLSTAGKNITIGSTITESATISDGTYSAKTRTSDILIDGSSVGKLYRNAANINTWNDLSDIKDTDTWYEYGRSYLNAGDYAADGKTTIADLYETHNTSFTLVDGTYNLTVSELVDTGIGYMEFSESDTYVYGASKVTFNINAENGGILNTAGYVVNADVDLHLKFNNPESYVREWRKTGEGDLYIDGTGDNYTLLNIGGSGKTYLQQTDGFAAYDVLVNTGSTLVIQDQNQVARDVTIGSGGGTLDMNGVSMTWNNSSEVDAEGFHIRVLTEGGSISNTSSTDTTLTIQNAGSSFVGSFVDVAGKGALNIIYDGGIDSTWALNTIHTDLDNSGKSSFTVSSGTVSLSGTNTKHGTYSISGYNSARYFDEDDWHYADAAMNVVVKDQGTFNLGSHARLNGSVTINAGGTFILNESVRHAMEYVEGGQTLEDTTQYAAYNGLKGNIVNNGTMQVVYSEGTDADTTYSKDISGSGSMSFDLGTTGGTFTMTGSNTTSGSNEIISGGVITNQLGSGSWKVGEKGYLAATGVSAEDALAAMTGDSEGALALTADQTTALSLSNHKGVIIGAQSGKTVHYGSSTDSLAAIENTWVLGGGGGNLYVDFILANQNATLVLGNEYTTGTVTLTNTKNSIGNISFAGAVTLEYTNVDALGNAKIDLAYTNRLMGADGIESAIKEGSKGVLLIDSMTSVDLSGKSLVSVGARNETSFSGTIKIDDGAAYHLGGGDGKLVMLAELAAGHDVIVDAQGYSGASVILGKLNSALNGALTVTGSEDDEVDAGDILLMLDEEGDGLLNNITDVTLKDGGALDVNGTDETLKNLTMATGSTLQDSAETAGEIKATGTISLNGTITTDGLNITGDDTTATAASSASLGNVTKVSNGATLNMGAENVTKAVNLDGGTLSVEDSTISGAISASGENNILTNSGTGALGITGSIAVAQGGKLSINSSTINLTASNYNTAENSGTISLGTTQVNLNNGGTINIGGTLAVQDDATATLYSMGSKDNMTRNISALSIGAGATAVLSAQSWNTIWNVHQLSGGGNLNWNATTNHWYSSRLILDGDNSSFTGNITLTRNGSTQAGRNYQAFLELANDNAATKATLTINGNNSSKMAALAINTDNAQVGGLSGNAYAAVYAGAAVAGDSSDSTSLSNAAVSTAAHTLTISGNGGTYSGVVNAEEDGNGLTLVMNGTGTQTFDGSSVTVNGVTVKQGTLNLAATQLAINGNLDVQGGLVKLTKGESMTLTGDVTLTGGTLDVTGGFFEGKGITAASGASSLIGDVDMGLTVDSSASLAISKSSVSTMITNSGTISLSADVFFSVEESELTANNSVKLISGTGTGTVSFDQLSTDNIKVNGNSLSEYTGTATFSTKDGGLYLNFGSQMGQDLTWDGTTSTYTWDLGTTKDWKTDASAASGASRLDSLDFANDAANKSVTVATGAVADSLKISGTGYTFTGSAFSVNKDMTVTGSATVNTDSTVGGNLTVSNGGDLTVGATMSVAGVVQLNGGTLNVTKANALTTTGVTVSGDSTLKGTLDTTISVIGGAKATLTSAAVNTVIQNAGTVNIGSDVTFNITTDDLLTGSYDLIQGSGSASLTGNTSKGNFSVNVDGTDIGSCASSYTVSSSGGSLTLSLTERTLVWSATSGSGNYTWSASTVANQWKTQETSVSASVYEFDNIVFDSTSTSKHPWAAYYPEYEPYTYVKVSDARSALDVTVKDAMYYITGNTGSITALRNMTLASDGNIVTVPLTVGGDFTISGKNNQLSGNITVDGNMRIGDGTIFGGNITAAGEIQLDGSITFSGGGSSVIGTDMKRNAESYGITKTRSGSVEFSKALDVAYYSISTSYSSVSTFNGESTIDTVTVGNGQFIVGEAGSLDSDTATVATAGTMQLNGAADITTLTTDGTTEVTGVLTADTATVNAGGTMNLNGSSLIGTLTNNGTMSIGGTSNQVGTLTANADVTVAAGASVSATELSVAGGAKLAVNGTAQATGLTVEGDASIGHDGKLAVGTATIKNGATLTATDEAVAPLYTVSGNGTSDATISNSSLGAYAIEGGRVDNAIIDLAAGATVEMRDIILSASSRLTDDSATVLSNGMQVEVAASNSSVSTSSVNSGVSLKQTAGTNQVLTGTGEYIYSITLNNVDSVAITGNGLTFVLTDATLKTEATSGYQWVGITFADGTTLGDDSLTQASVDAANVAVTLDIGGTSYQGYYEPADGSDTSSVYFQMYVTPEPATTTLSLLALAGLAARRRRR